MNSFNPTQVAHTPPREHAIILAAFGTTIRQARNVYDNFESLVREQWPVHDVRWTFTSTTVRRALAEEGKIVLDPPSTLEQIRREGFRSAVIQSLHVTPGEEFSRLSSISAEGLHTIFGRPLFDKEKDEERVFDAVASEVKPDVPTVFVAHGNTHRREFDGVYQRLVNHAHDRFPESVLASLEGVPGPEPLDRIKARVTETKRVHFVPLLFVAGDHVLNDVMGDEPESWKNLLGAKEATCSPPLGERQAVLEIYLEHLAIAIEESKLHV